MELAPLAQGSLLDPRSALQDRLSSPEVDIGRRQAVQAFMIGFMVVVLDERRDTAARSPPTRAPPPGRLCE